MHLTNTVPVKAPPDAVFALVNDVERVASCMPGATLDGRDGMSWHGRVKVKVGPITAAYAGTVRFLDVDTERRRLRVQARGADTHGSGDAEAEVVVEVAEAGEGARLDISTDLVIRGKIAQFGKGAIGAVSDRILQRFAQNLGSLLDQDRALGTSGQAAAGPAAPAGATAERPAAPAVPTTPAASAVPGPAAPVANVAVAAARGPASTADAELDGLDRRAHV